MTQEKRKTLRAVPTARRLRSLEFRKREQLTRLVLQDGIFISYQVHFQLKSTLRVNVGKLGRCVFPPGDYVYTGSAKKNLQSRILRHLSNGKVLRWHIDYLLRGPKVRFSKAVISEMDECRLNRRLGGRVVVMGFGATDCKAGCGSHLKFIDKRKSSLRQTRTDMTRLG